MPRRAEPASDYRVTVLHTPITIVLIEVPSSMTLVCDPRIASSQAHLPAAPRLLLKSMLYSGYEQRKAPRPHMRYTDNRGSTLVILVE